MKLKAKLISMISAFCLVCVMLVVGIYALKSANFQMGGEISFKATGVNATISKGELATGSHVDPADATTKMQGFQITTAEDQDEINSLASSWSGLKLQFNATGDDATITFTIKNDNTASDQYLGVAITVNQGTVDNAKVTVSPATAVIEPTKTQEFVVTFSVIQKDMDSSLKGFTLDFDLSHLTIMDLLSFYTDDSNMTATFYGCIWNDYAIGLETINVPASITVNNKTYTVERYEYDSMEGMGLDQCTNLKELVLPSTINYIGQFCFNSFPSSMTKLILEAEVPPTLLDATEEKPNLKIYVPAESVDDYKAATGWSNYADYIYAIREELNVTFDCNAAEYGKYMHATAPTAYKGEDFTFTVTHNMPMYTFKVTVQGTNFEQDVYCNAEEYEFTMTIPAEYMTQDLIIRIIHN